MKKLIWKESSYSDVKRFSKSARREIGFELHTVQAGQEPSDWKPMPSVGAGVKEIRVKQGNQYRVI